MGVGKLSYSCLITSCFLQEILACRRENGSNYTGQLSRLTDSSRFISRSSGHDVHPFESTKSPNPNQYCLLKDVLLKSLSTGFKML